MTCATLHALKNRTVSALCFGTTLGKRKRSVESSIAQPIPQPQPEQRDTTRESK